ncbi:MAG: GIY-YIG nuclease family protein [Opitutaceae bacterium]
MMFFVYILENPAGRFYNGHTDDLARRLRQHNEPVAGLGKFTHKNGPWRLVWSELHESRSAAMLRERVIKSWKSAARIRRELLDNVR